MKIDDHIALLGSYAGMSVIFKVNSSIIFISIIKILNISYSMKFSNILTMNKPSASIISELSPFISDTISELTRLSYLRDDDEKMVDKRREYNKQIEKLKRRRMGLQRNWITVAGLTKRCE